MHNSGNDPIVGVLATTATGNPQGESKPWEQGKHRQRLCVFV